MHRCPADTMVSSRIDFWFQKSSWSEITFFAQQESASFLQPLLHWALRPCCGHKPCSSNTTLSSLGFPRSNISGWSSGNVIGCGKPLNIPERIFGCFPPGLRFIFWAARVSDAKVAWLVLLSKANTAVQPGCRFSKIGMALSLT